MKFLLEPEPHMLLMVASIDLPTPGSGSKLESTVPPSGNRLISKRKHCDGNFFQGFLCPKCLGLFLSLEIWSSLFSFDGYSKDVLGNEPLSGMLQRLDRWLFFIQPSKPLTACSTEHVMEAIPQNRYAQAICENRSMGMCVLASEKYFKVHWPGMKVQDDKY